MPPSVEQEVPPLPFNPFYFTKVGPIRSTTADAAAASNPEPEQSVTVTKWTESAQEQTRDSRREGLIRLISNKGGVAVGPEEFLQFGGVQIGSPVTKSLIIQNTTAKGILLNSINVHGIQNVCMFVATTIRKRESESILAYIEPGGTYVVNVTCTAHLMGKTMDFMVLEFSHCQIGRLLKATALSAEVDLVNEIKMRDLATGFRAKHSWQEVSENALARIMDDKKLELVQGINPIRQPFFCQKRMKQYNIPGYLWDIVAGDDEDQLLRKHPNIAHDLNMTNYLDKFQVGLWLEEMDNIIIRRQYDLEDIILQPAGAYMKFEVPGLKDIRPPLVAGDPILVIHDQARKKYKAFIFEMKDDMIYTKLPEEFATKCRNTPVRIEFRQGRSVYKRCHFAVEHSIGYLGEDWLFPNDNVEIKKPRISFIEVDDSPLPSESTSATPDEQPGQTTKAPKGKRLFVFRRPSTAALRVERFSPFRKDRTIDKRLPSIMDTFKSNTRGPSTQTVCLSWFNKVLNNEQKNAVRGILRGECRPLPYIIFGPPGAGKTVTIVESVLQIYKLDKFSRTLVVASSNSAVDRIAEQLVSSGQFTVGDFVRLIGYLRVESQIPESVRPFCMDGDHLANVAGHRLIVSTCTTAGQFHQLNLEAGHFTHVFIDEAGYCTEPEALVAASLVALRHSGQLVLAGDPKQLGPVLMSPAARTCGLSLSLLERLMSCTIYARNEEGFPVEHYNPAVITKLVKNYRAHATLLELPSSLFYDGELEAAAEEESVSLYKSLDFMKHRDSPLLFHGIQGNAGRDKMSPSWFNMAEVIQVIDYVRRLRQNGVDNKDIGIITPYRKQVEKIRKALQLILRSDTDDLPRIGSVEEFQGDERQVIILSLVRSNWRKDELDEVDIHGNQDNLKFIFSDKRFNVAITRAKSALIVLGNPHVLIKDPTWNSFIKHCIAQGSYIGCNLPANLQFRPTTLNLCTPQLLPSSSTESLAEVWRQASTPVSPISPVGQGFGNIFRGIMQFTNSITLATAASVFNFPRSRTPSIISTSLTPTSIFSSLTPTSILSSRTTTPSESEAERGFDSEADSGTNTDLSDEVD